MSFVYPRTISVSRQTALSGIGAQPYQALNIANETILLSDIPASIQQKKQLKVAFAHLPGDGQGVPSWNIYIPKKYAALGDIKNFDIVTDDLNNRYQVTAAYWDSLGYRCECEQLQN